MLQLTLFDKAFEDKRSDIVKRMLEIYTMMTSEKCGCLKLKEFAYPLDFGSYGNIKDIEEDKVKKVRNRSEYFEYLDIALNAIGRLNECIQHLKSEKDNSKEAVLARKNLPRFRKDVAKALLDLESNE